MTRWSGGFPPPNWHHHRNKVEDTLVTVTSTTNRDTGTLAAPFPEERTNIPPWIRGLMNFHRS